MKTLKRHWQRIPRPLRACLNLLAIGLLLVTFYARPPSVSVWTSAAWNGPIW